MCSYASVATVAVGPETSGGVSDSVKSDGYRHSCDGWFQVPRCMRKPCGVDPKPFQCVCRFASGGGLPAQR